MTICINGLFKSGKGTKSELAASTLPSRGPKGGWKPYCNTLACKSEVVHFFVNHNIRAFGVNGLCIRVGKKGPHSMALYASGGPIILG